MKISLQLTHILTSTSRSKLILAASWLLLVPLRPQDNTALININNLEQLDAMRYDLDGDGLPTSAGESDWETAFGMDVTADDNGDTHNGSSITGYELTKDLDFEDANSYSSGTVNSDWVNPGRGGTPETEGWLPIGNSSSFKGVFEGNDYVIFNLFILRFNIELVGLFSLLDSPAEIRNVGIEGGFVEGMVAGGLAGSIAESSTGATISGCYSTVNVTAGGGLTGIAGGLVGRNRSGNIVACYATGNVEARGDNCAVGGLVGHNSGNIIACYATGYVDTRGNNHSIGGLVGRNRNGNIVACYATGNVEMESSNTTGISGEVSAGGLVGYSAGSNIPGSNSIIGACYATGNVESVGDDTYVGGLVGGNFAEISACYATGNVEARGGDVYIGGLVGRNALDQTTNESGLIFGCYSTGRVMATGVSHYIGGLVGESRSATVTESYFDQRTSEVLSGGIGAQTTSALQSPEDYADIYVNWNIDVDDGLSRGADDGTIMGDFAGDDPWDFGTATDYPVLKIDFGKNPDGIATAEEFMPPPAITRINPIRGRVNTEVTINGRNFGDTANDNEVTFLGTNDDGSDDQRATISTSTITQIVVRVPAGAQTGKISVRVDDEIATSTQIFTVLPEPPPPPPLEIISFSPESGAVGDPIKIAGTGFSSTTANNEVSFDGGTTYVVANNFIDDTRTGVDPTIDTLVVNVPSDAVTETIWVKVSDGTPVESANEFTVLAAVLAITSIDPTEGAVGEEVTIEGQNFGATAADNMVTFLGDESDEGDNQVATISEASTTRLVVNVPDDAISGPIEVEVNGETATSEAFTVTDGTKTPFSVPKSSDVVRVYPNPTSAELSFRSLSSTDTYVYKIYSLLGQEMLSDVLKGTTIDMSTLAEGQYILVLSSEGDSEVLRTRLLIVR